MNLGLYKIDMQHLSILLKIVTMSAYLIH